MIKLYYRDISKFSPLIEEEEQQLVILVGQGDEQARKTAQSPFPLANRTDKS